MHGIILNGLKTFVTETYDEQTWQMVCDGADLRERMYVPVTTYPDEHVARLVESAASVSGKDAAELQRLFGRYIVPRLVGTYSVHIEEGWTGLDLIENAEDQIHVALRGKTGSNFEPPELDARRVDEDTIVVHYDSQRGLCAVAKGIIDGVGDHYDESYEIVERQCVHDGADHCELVVSRDDATVGVDRRTAELTDGGERMRPGGGR